MIRTVPTHPHTVGIFAYRYLSSFYSSAKKQRQLSNVPYIQCCRSWLSGVPGSVSGSSRAKKTHKNRKKFINFIFFKCWKVCFEGWRLFLYLAWTSCNFDFEEEKKFICFLSSIFGRQNPGSGLDLQHFLHTYGFIILLKQDLKSKAKLCRLISPFEFSSNAMPSFYERVGSFPDLKQIRIRSDLPPTINFPDPVPYSCLGIGLALEAEAENMFESVQRSWEKLSSATMQWRFWCQTTWWKSWVSQFV